MSKKLWDNSRAFPLFRRAKVSDEDYDFYLTTVYIIV